MIDARGKVTAIDIRGCCIMIISIMIPLVCTVYAEIWQGPYLQLGNYYNQGCITVRWFTRNHTTGMVQYGKQPGPPYQHQFETSTVTNEHEANITNLSPGDRYYYRVISDGSTTDEYSFIAPSHRADVSVRFAAYGDNRSSPSGHESVIQSILEHDPLPLFILSTGDIVASGEERQQWHDQFFTPGVPLFRLLPVIPSPGNHEYEDAFPYDKLPHEWFDFLSLPHNGTSSGREQWYSFDWGNCHFVCLDVNCYPWDAISILAQKSWLRSDLAGTSKPWRIVFFHQPPWAKGAHDSDLTVRLDLCPVFDEYNVDIVFNGHDHFYQRSYPLTGSEATSTEPSGYTDQDGVVYVVTGCGGVGPSTSEDDWFVAAREDVRHHCIIDISGNYLTLKAIRYDGSEIDRFTISKFSSPTPTPTPIQSPTSTPTPYLTETPLPSFTPTASPPPSDTPTATMTHTMTPTPTLPAGDLPDVFIAGYMTTRLTTFSGGELTMLAYALDWQLAPAEEVQIYYAGSDTGLRLSEVPPDSGIFIFPPLTVQPGIKPGLYLLEFRALDKEGYLGHTAPYLIIVD